MTAIEITAMEPAHFGVQITEGAVTTSHRVFVSDGFIDDLQLGDVDRERIVSESLAFLLERVVATSIPAELSLDKVGREHPDFHDELLARLAAA